MRANVVDFLWEKGAMLSLIWGSYTRNQICIEIVRKETETVSMKVSEKVPPKVARICWKEAWNLLQWSSLSEPRCGRDIGYSRRTTVMALATMSTASDSQHAPDTIKLIEAIHKVKSGSYENLNFKIQRK